MYLYIDSENVENCRMKDVSKLQCFLSEPEKLNIMFFSWLILNNHDINEIIDDIHVEIVFL